MALITSPKLQFLLFILIPIDVIVLRRRLWI